MGSHRSHAAQDPTFARSHTLTILPLTAAAKNVYMLPTCYRYCLPVERNRRTDIARPSYRHREARYCLGVQSPPKFNTEGYEDHALHKIPKACDRRTPSVPFLSFSILGVGAEAPSQVLVDPTAVVVVQALVDLRVDGVLLLPGRVAAHHIGPLAVARGRPASVPGVVHELDITTSA